MNSTALEAMSNKALAYYRSNHSDFIECLKGMVRIPSVSFPGYDPSHLTVAAQDVCDRFENHGLRGLDKLETSGGPPCLHGEWTGGQSGSGVLLYAHYDVQPPLREELWLSPPFEPVERDGRLFGRGAGDDKAGVAVHLAAISSYMRACGEVPLHVKVLLEGEEEIGSPHLKSTLLRHAKRLVCDAAVVMDGGNYACGLPTITSSMRGLAIVNVRVAATDRALHSGLWGGPIPDPVQGLIKVLAGLLDENGRIAIPEFRDGIEPLSSRERSDLAALNMTSSEFRGQAGVKPGVQLFGKDSEILERLWHEPSLVVNSFIAGDRKTAGNVLLDSAWARVGVRLVSGLEPARALEILTRTLRERCPWGLEMEIRAEENVSAAWKANLVLPAYAVARKAFSEGYGKPAVFAGDGATVPVVGMIAEQMPKSAPILVGLLDPYSNPHAENESVSIADFHRAVESEIRLFAEMARVSVQSPG